MPDANSFPAPPPPRARRPRWWGDLVFRVLTAAGALILVGALLAIIGILFNGSSGSRLHSGIGFLFGQWDPNHNLFDILPFISGTLVTSGIALLLAVPVALGTSIFLTQLAPNWLPSWGKASLSQIIELLAAIPSIIYGFWGIFVLIPFLKAHVDFRLSEAYQWVGGLIGGPDGQVNPGLAAWAGANNPFGGRITGYDLFTASIVISIMMVPTIAAISRDALAAVPIHQREAALSLGATPWEATRFAVLPYARSGIFGGTILGLGRALGETMAVTLVIGNSSGFPNSLFGPGQTVASLIANQFGESAGPLEYSALIEAGLVLLLITLAVNIGARAILWRYQRNAGIGRE
jgi:phosphate transport system permease protein